MLRKTFHSLSPCFQIAVPSMEFTMGKILLLTVCLRASKNLLIQQKEVVLSIKYIMPGLLYVCFYDEWYFDVGNHISVENYDVNIKFLQPNGPAIQFFRPGLQDTCWIPIQMIILQKYILCYMEASILLL